MGNPHRLFKGLVVLSAIAYVLWFFQSWLEAGWISPDTWDALAWNSFGAILPIPPGIGWLLFLLNIAVSLGLYMFSRPARMLFGALTLFFFVMTPLGGIQVETPFGALLVLLMNMADGGILIMAYTAPIREAFK